MKSMDQSLKFYKRIDCLRKRNAYHFVWSYRRISEDSQEAHAFERHLAVVKKLGTNNFYMKLKWWFQKNTK